jgi:ubiquitination network signaling protein AcrB
VSSLLLLVNFCCCWLGYCIAFCWPRNLFWVQWKSGKHRMPRASSAKRQQGAAANRDTRHENGLVGPGKRIVKQKSRNEIRSDGSPRPHLQSSASEHAAPLPPPSPLPNTSAPCANGNGNGNGYLHGPDDMPLDTARRPSVAAYSETSSSESVSLATSQAATEDAHRRIDVNAAKNNNVHRDTGFVDLAFTVLRSCPLHDTIAILIILMQLSPVVLSSIYMLFTLLTFVPPVTTSSGLSLTEIFDGPGAPNLWTLVGLDLFFLIVFAFMPLQDLILDFAQVVIAMTLGGGASSRAGTTHHIFLCAGIVLFNHFGHHQAINRYSSFKNFFGGPWTTPDADDLKPLSISYDRKGPKGVFRSILAIHILVQGLVRYVREWYLRREKRDLLSQSQPDPEAGKTPTLAGDTGTDGGGLPPTDVPEASRQLTSTNISNKKRRKQSHQVRIRQPLWAALASTKIVMVKEYELSHAATESAGSNATDIHNLGNAPFNTQPEQVWICYVGCDTVCFNTSPFPDQPASENTDQDSDGKGLSYVDTSKPFYVKVNKAIWQPTRIMPIDDGEEEGVQGTRWTGDIFGLTPMSNYECEFVSTRTGKTIFSTSLRTLPPKIKDNDALKAPAPRSQYRHQSPATTLRTSIAGLEQKLNDEKARLKSLRRDNNRKTNALKKDIDRLTSAVQSAGGNDEKLRQKIAQNMTQQKQAEQAIAELQEQVKELQSIPEEVLEDYRKKQGQYNSEKGQFDQAKGAFKSFKNSVDHDAKALDDEQTSLQAKRTKIAARLNKVDGEHARITDANARGLDEADRRRQETAAFESDAARKEKQYADRLAVARAQNDEKTQNAAHMANMLQGILASFGSPDYADYASYYERQEAAAYHNAASQWPQYAHNHTWSPATSAALPNATLATAPAPGPLFSHRTFPQYPQQPSHVPLPRKSRGRSSSMLSDVSGLTQSTDDENDGSNGSNNNSSAYINGGAMVRGSSTINATAAPFLPPSHTASARQSPFGQYAYPAAASGGDVRSPPGFPPFPPGDVRKASGSNSGSGSGSGSVRSGVASSEGSNKDPASPYPKKGLLSV